MSLVVGFDTAVDVGAHVGEYAGLWRPRESGRSTPALSSLS